MGKEYENDDGDVFISCVFRGPFPTVFVALRVVFGVEEYVEMNQPPSPWCCY